MAWGKDSDKGNQPEKTLCGWAKYRDHAFGEKTYFGWHITKRVWLGNDSTRGDIMYHPQTY
jgi:hypothetical protein